MYPAGGRKKKREGGQYSTRSAAGDEGGARQ